MNIFIIKCYIRANLKIDVTENKIFWCISLAKLKSEIHSPGYILLTMGFQSKHTFCSKSFTTGPSKIGNVVCQMENQT